MDADSALFWSGSLRPQAALHPNPIPNIYQYQDYRQYLRDYYREQKQAKRNFSYRYFSEKAGINASAFLYYVITQAPFVIRAIRTDCGKEWGTRFSLACALAGITHIRNEPYHPEHNGKIEKFHDGLKYRCCYVYLHPSDPLPQLNSDLQQWLTWYNYHKIHLGLGMDRKTPAEVVLRSLLEESSCVRSMLQPNIL